MDSDDYTSDDDKGEEILIDNIPKEVISIYENAINKNTIGSVRDTIIYLLHQYDILRKVSDFENEMAEIYEDTVKHYMYWQAPLEVFDTNNYNLQQKFVQWAYSSTERGIELEYLEQIYFSLI
jgi:hypothetical protein